jgi:transposase
MSLKKIICRSQKIEYKYARNLLSKALFDKGMSKSAIGRLFRRNHVTIINYINNYANEEAYNPTFRMMSKKVNELIGKAV